MSAFRQVPCSFPGQAHALCRRHGRPPAICKDIERLYRLTSPPSLSPFVLYTG